MEDKKGFTIEVSSPYTEFWRYNVAIMCGCFDIQDTRTGFASTEDAVADMGANLTVPPEGYAANRVTVLETPPADHIVLYIYVIPHTLPHSSDVADTRPFPLSVRIVSASHNTQENTYQINQWSGTSLELRVGEIITPTEQRK